MEPRYNEDPRGWQNLFTIERFSLDCRIGIVFGFGFGFTTSFGWLVYLLWFWFYDSQVKTALTRFRYVKVLFHIFFYYWDKENCSLYRGLLGCLEVRYIEVPLYYYFIAQNNSYNMNYLSP